METRGQVGGILMDAAIAFPIGAELRLFCIAVPVVDVRDRAGYREPAIVRGIQGVELGEGNAGDQLMLMVEQLERAGQVYIQTVLPGRVRLESCRLERGSRSAGLVQRAADIGHHGVIVVAGVAVFRLAVPAVAELVLQRGEDTVAGVVVVGPARGAVGRALEAGTLAIAVK
ncbi:hypothetical protein DNJ95_06655 [Stutzerimonas kirkiae]|uniref:Uncharacterized protein n=1 Tax=Stutzerimonas kirkiae TaxID=2211392 RepID=A0A4Q9R977_9GAMM|nr:hypothetical protein DNJ96_09010 [Stutzerimonas kirkiae]TBV03631.1 hypothetical protein DNJ95_06655 [Stutzerimonas kirkiae]